MNQVKLCLIVISIAVLFVSMVKCSPFKVEEEFDSDFGRNREASDDSDSTRWGRSSMRGRKFSGRDLEKSGDNDFREVNAGNEDEASEELAAKNQDFEKDDNGRMKGRGDEEDEERPFMREDDGVPDRYIKIKKAAQEDAIARTERRAAQKQRPRQTPKSTTEDEVANVEVNAGESDGETGSSVDGSSTSSEAGAGDESAASGATEEGQQEEENYPKERQEEYDEGKKEGRNDEVTTDGTSMDVEGNGGFEDGGATEEGSTGSMTDVGEDSPGHSVADVESQPAEPEE